MSSLFGSKRRRPPNQPLTTSTAHSDAATAALSAFSRRESSPSLSEAAAAAALKAQPHIPTDVSSVVPKRRSVRRSASGSSHGTPSPHPPLERAGSAGSMRDRTFRSPSPHGRQPLGGASGATAQPAERDMLPPVPSIPAGVQASNQQPARVGSLRITTAPVRVASQKLKDGGAKGAGTWFGAPAVGDLSNVRTSDAALARNETVATAPRDPYTRPESRSSVNFSYPSRLRLGTSPPPSPRGQEHEAEQLDLESQSQSKAKRSSMTPSQPTRKASTKQRPASMSAAPEMVYDPNSRRMVPRAELVALEQVLGDVEAKQPARKKKLSRAGSHLAKGSTSRTQTSEPTPRRSEPAPGSPVAAPAVQEYAPPATSGYIEVRQLVVDANRARPAPERNERADESAVDGRTYIDNPRQVASPSNYLPEVVAAGRSQASPTEAMPSGYMLGKRPSVIEEQAEMEATEAERPPPPHAAADALDSVRMRQYTYDRPSAALQPRPQSQAQQLNTQPAKARASPAELSAEAPEADPVNAIKEEQPASPVEPKPTNTFGSQRTHSNSPVRVAHFGPVQRTLSVRHSPPPRSVSPRKSALKQHSPPQSTASDDGAEAAVASSNQDEAHLGRKRSVRVSFNDKETVVGTDESADASSRRAESPTSSGPPSGGRRTWFSNIGRSKKKDVTSLDDDEVMKPRPALPSFGSVREKKKSKEEEERPLVRPGEPTFSVPSPESSSARPGTASSDARQKNGLTQGGGFSQDFAPRIPANTSRFREPLPPVVTSREGSGYISNTDSSFDSDEEMLRDTPVLSSQPSVATSAPDIELEPKATPSFMVPPAAPPAGDLSRRSQDHAYPSEPKPNAAPTAVVPAIAISEPSPGTSEGPERLAVVPGGFPDDEYEDAPEQQPTTMHPLDGQAAREATFEPVSQALDAKTTVHTPATVAATQAVVADDSDSDETSIYSDAYEDPADMDDSGFQSIDAIVDSPVFVDAYTHPQGDTAPVKVPDETVQRPPTPVTSPAPQVVARAVPFNPIDDWEAAKAYWRSLTADKRAQLEREALEEAGAEADLEQDAKLEAGKPRRKKSVEKRQAEKRAIKEATQDSPDRVSMIRPGTKAQDDVTGYVLKKSMRQGAPQEAVPAGRPILRKSMRGNAISEQQQPLTGQAIPEPQPQRLTKQDTSPRRPKTANFSPSQAAAGAARTHDRTNSDASSLPQRSGTMTSFFPPALKRRGSTSSESSFRRSTTRRTSAGLGAGESGGFAMRKTMRGSGSPDREQAEFGRRFSLRSFSPADSTRRNQVAPSPPVSFQNQQRMRSSLRDGQGMGGKTKASGGGMHMPSFGLRPKSSKGKKSSRFGDSSDEDEVAGSGFRSRFEDSSDDEVSAPPPPMPALSSKTMRSGAKDASSTRPKTVPEEESPDLPDSDDEKPAAPARATLVRAASSGSGRAMRPGFGMAHQTSRSGRGAALGTSLMKSDANNSTGAVGSAPASPTGRRGSFMSTVLRRKKTSNNDAGKIQRGEVMDSAARRDTVLERSQQELSLLRQRRTASMPTVPKMQRSHSGDADDDWPLATPADEDDEERTIGSSRPSFAKRRSLSQSNSMGGAANRGLVVVPDDMDEMALATRPGSHKKKRFPALRRMFRLDN